MILCCGEALIDMIPAPLAAGGDGFAPHPGGAVFNTAVALGRLGAEAGLLSGISEDLFGARLLAALEESRVATGLLICSKRPTTLAFVQLADGQASYAFFDEESAGRMLTPGDMPALPAQVSCLFFGGISLASLPCGDAYAALLASQAGDRPVMLDPNIRPRFIVEETAYRARLARMLARADIVKLSDEDLDWLVPGDLPPEEKIARLAEVPPPLTLITRGRQGATAHRRDGSQLFVPARPVRVADTVGAGDTFNAGFLASLQSQGALTRSAIATLSDKALTQALTLATRAAAETVSRPGANPPWAGEL
jgi:fructokinase